MKQTKTYKYHLILIFSLSIVFLALLFLSFDKDGGTYVFEDKIVLQSFELGFDNTVKIGSAKFSNDGILPKRIYLKSYVGCAFDLNLDTSFNIFYYGVRTSNSYDFFNEYNKGKFIELNPKKNEDLTIFTRSLPYLKNSNENFSSLVGTNFNLYLFEDESNNYYDYEACRGLSKENAVKIIEVSIE